MWKTLHNIRKPYKNPLGFAPRDKIENPLKTHIKTLFILCADSEVTHDRRRMDRISSNDDWRNRQLMHTVTTAAPQELCLGHVQLQAKVRENRYVFKAVRNDE